MESPLAAVTKDQISPEPYPHVVAPDVLEEDVCLRLVDELPPLEVVTKMPDPPSNKGYALPAHEALEHPEVSETWRELIRSCISQEFLGEVMELFGDHIRALYPDLESQAGELGSLRAGLRHVDTFDDADVLLDAEILVTTPVSGAPSSSRSPHVDDVTRLFNGQLYFRMHEDDTSGADVELYRFRNGPGGFTKRDIDPSFIEPVKSVPYDRGSLLFMLNALDGVHAVTDRPVTPQPRFLLNLIAHLERPLFDVGPYQVNGAAA